MNNLLQVISRDGSLRGFFLDSTDIVERARNIHALFPVACAAMGRTLTACSMMGALLKDEENSITLQIRGDGPIGSIVTAADSYGNVRGYVGNGSVVLPANPQKKFDVSGAVGKGIFVVSKDLKMKEPYVSQVPIISGEIAEDVASYFSISEQTPTLCALGVLVNTETLAIKAAGGYIVQPLPFADSAVVEQLEENAKTVEPVSQILASERCLLDLANEVFRGIPFDILSESKVDYACDCKRERVEKTLISLGKKELNDLIREEGKADITCRFCDKKYHFSKEDLERLLK